MACHIRSLVTEPQEAPLLSCLQNLSMPILMGVPLAIVQLIQRSSHFHKVLNPATWIRGNLHPSSISRMSTAMRLLEYVSRDEQMDQLYDLPVFTHRNGTIASLTKLVDRPGTATNFSRKLYIGTMEESGLFGASGERFLRLTRHPLKVSARIQSQPCQCHLIWNNSASKLSQLMLRMYFLRIQNLGRTPQMSLISHCVQLNSETLEVVG